MGQRVSMGIRLALGSLLGLLLLLIAFRDVDMEQVMKAVRGTQPAWLLLALLSVLFTLAGKAYRWKWLFHPREADLAFWQLFRVLLVGMALNAALPARVGELARAYLVGELEERSKASVLATIVVEKTLEAIMLLVSLAFLLAVISLPTWLSRSKLAAAVLLAALSIALILIARNRERVTGWLHRLSIFIPSSFVKSLIQKVMVALEGVDSLGSWRVVAWSLGLSAAIWAVAASTNWLVLSSMGIVAPWWSSLLLLVVLQVGAAIPTSPGRVGVFHYLGYFTLTAIGIEGGRALAYSVVLHLVVFLPMMVLGGFFTWKAGYQLFRLAEREGPLQPTEEVGWEKAQ
ncbi:MAG TPA: hypothetical protein DCP08_02740 [Chloroflexi bacterium]|nr:hypothetical protein [Chloroflexota bacterium]